MSLEEILDAARLRAARLPDDLPGRETRRRSLRRAIDGRTRRNAIIGELKYASPSVGWIGCRLSPAEMAMRMAEGGAVALSVLTESEYFGGSIENLRIARAHAPLPVLRKDFVVDERQVRETASMDADAILLIARVLGREIRRYVELSIACDLEPVVEVHDRRDLELALGTDAELIGVNNRDLATMGIETSITTQLGDLLKEHGRMVISMSGIAEPSDIRRLRGHCDAFLIGTAIMRSSRPEKTVEEFVCA